MNRLRIIAICLIGCLSLTPTLAVAQPSSVKQNDAQQTKAKAKTKTKKKKKAKKKAITAWTTTAVVNSADEYGVNLTFVKPSTSLATFLKKHGGADQDVNDNNANVTVDGEDALLENLCDGMTATVKVKQYKNELYVSSIKAKSAECYATGGDDSADGGDGESNEDGNNTGDDEYDYSLVASRR